MQFTEILDRYHIRYQTEGKYCRPGWIAFDCPFCRGGLDPNKPYAGYNLARGSVNCWRCGPHPVGTTLMQLTRLKWSDVKSLLDDLDRPRFKDEIKPAGRLVLPHGLCELQKPHRRYLERRGYDPDEIAERYGVKGIALASRLSWRLFIPIHFKGEIVSWTTRSIDPNETLRYISASMDEEAIPHKHLLYGEDLATNAISIHEGSIDTWRVGHGAVATLGTGYSSNQILRMIRYPRRIVCFDSEKAAQRRANKLCDLLEGYDGETYNIVLDAKSADEESDETIEKIRKLLS